MDATPTHIYAGPRDRVIAEAGARDFYPGKYLVQPYSGTAEFIPGDCANLKELRAEVAAWRKRVPGIKVVWL